MVTLSFLTGCAAAPYWHGGAWPWVVVAAALLSAWLLHRSGKCASAMLALCFLALGMLHTHAAMVAVQPAPGQYTITGLVCGGAKLRADDRITFMLADIALDGTPTDGRAYCSLHYSGDAPVLFDGAQVRLQGRVYLPDGRSGEPHMDFRLWMRQNDLDYGIAAHTGVEVLNTAADAPVKDAAWRVRQAMQRSLGRVMGDDARIAMALLFGVRDGLTDSELRDFQTLGIAHVMSVSGLHVSIIGGMVWRLLSMLRMRRRHALPVLCVLLTAYCWVTGFSAASLRAAVTLVYLNVAGVLRRKPDRLSTLAAAMLTVLVIDPLHASSAGFILSFSAVLGIYLLSPPLRRLFEAVLPPIPHRRTLLRRMVRCAANAATVSLSAQAGVLLPTAFFFHQLPLYGVFINVLIVPFVSAVLVPVYIATLMLSVLPFAFVGAPALLLTSLLLRAVALLGELPGAVLRVASPAPVLCIGGALAAVLLTPRIPARFSKRLVAALMTMAIAACGAFLSRPPQLRYIQLAVGQADSALLMDGDMTVLIDAGDDGEAALDYLLCEGRDVDALILTHLHMDHAGGVHALLDAGIVIRRAYLPVNAQNQRCDPDTAMILTRLREAGVPVTHLAQGDELCYNSTVVRVLWPDADAVRSGHDANDYPLVLAVDFGGYTILCASDLTGAYEKYVAVPADVLKVAHHGSDGSTDEDFLAYIDPAIALISCSSGSATLPAPETLSRLSQSGAVVLRTDVGGDITLTLQGGMLCATPYKETHP